MTAANTLKTLKAMAAIAITVIAIVVLAIHSRTPKVQQAELVTVLWGLKALAGFVFKAALVGAAVATVTILSWDRVNEWFRARLHLFQNNPNRIAMSMLEKLKNGEFVVHSVVADHKTGNVVEQGDIRSNNIDPELENLYRQGVVVHS
jgi:hypothetical protein